MKINKLNEFKLGWFVGDFNPSLYKTQDVEVAVKKYTKGDCDNSHYHKIATEITVIISGRVLMNDVEYNENDIITIFPEESTNFIALEDTVTVCVKLPGAINDKYIL